jgi:hypothetical protein
MRRTIVADKGPVPLRSEERRRTNEPAHPIWKLGPDQLAALPFQIDMSPTPPPLPTRSEGQAWNDAHPDSKWCQLVTDWYEAIKVDPMVAWMTSADWGALMVLLEDLDRELKPQVVGITPATYSTQLDEVIGGEPVLATVPMKGAKMSAIVNFLKAFGIGEANRLRMQKEVQLFKEHATTVDAGGGDAIVETRLELLQGGQAS